jgi:aminocarboxymuconate-semialdehyde decarboxylase
VSAATRCGPGLIDMHCHVVPPSYPFGPDDDPRWPSLRVADDGASAEVIISASVFRVIRSSAWDFERRRDEMSRAGVAVQVVSPMPELFSYWAAADKAAMYCSAVNGWIAARVRAESSRPESFQGLGILPMQDPGAAIDSLAEVAALGLLGVEIGTNVNGVCISDARYRPVLAAAAERGLLVFVHAFHPAGLNSVSYPPAQSAVNFPLEVAWALESLIAEGVLAELPALRLMASHGGGATALALGRLEAAWQGSAEFQARLPVSPYECARRVLYDTLLFDPCALEYLIGFAGASQVVVGTDYPFGSVQAGEPLGRCAGLRAAERTAIERGNAARVIGAIRRGLGLEEGVRT